jgi:hypothetical protein
MVLFQAALQAAKDECDLKDRQIRELQTKLAAMSNRTVSNGYVAMYLDGEGRETVDMDGYCRFVVYARPEDVKRFSPNVLRIAHVLVTEEKP